MSLKIYTDGGNSLKNQAGGASAVLVQDETILAELSEAFIGPNITNNTMELWGVILGCNYVLDHPELGKEVTIVSDSEYVVNGSNTWLAKWKAKGWKTSTGKVRNLELWKAIDMLKSALNIKFEWTRGHSNNRLNNLADELAVKAYTKLLNKNKKEKQNEIKDTSSL